jgi:uncharacterized low-complexity protein
MSVKTMLVKPVAAAVGVAFVTSLAISTTALAADNPFAAADLDRGYLVAGEGEAEGEEGKAEEGKCGEGKCGEDKAEEGKCGEGKCGEDKAEAGAAEEAAAGSDQG